ncbi:MAG TPA: RNA polymerase sporulation sigma factor SigK [Candidatus Eisenbergiella stercorigallinarum]|uniref:RNA polymerase sigma factor n=1 Tax=Candidatus Eisenbergiella stercorigallinarum TaxID=2838557 RepID=A0A9D2QXW9_9FIRM|nr:RNA polymerase sporulation sigma factor SigK [Candidatus Eisenbergiella stercorigallinarum]
MKTFLKPLSKEEERECLEALGGSDGVKAREAKQKLIERNLRLVAHIAKKYQNVDEDMEDLISIGTIGLIKAVDSFDTGKNSRLATYAARCIDNELLMMLRSKKKTSREVSLYEPIGTDREGNEISLLDVTAQEMPDIVERLELERNLSRLSDMIDTLLTGREKQIIRLRYGLSGGEEATQREIAKELDISRSYVSRIEKRALLKLREGFEREENHRSF